jgi:vacuolar-type H+-ATPase subunit I/STV1
VFIKADIRKITVAVEKDRAAEVYLALGRAGIVHLARFADRDVSLGQGLAREEARIREIVAATDYAQNALQIVPDEAFLPAAPLDKEKDAAFAAAAAKALARALRLRARIGKAADAASRRIACGSALRALGIDPGVLQRARLVKTVFGTMEDEAQEPPAQSRFLLARAGRFVFGLALPEDAAALGEFLKNSGFADASADVSDLPPERLAARAASLVWRGAIVARCLERLKEEKGEALRRLNSAYRAYEEMLKAACTSLQSDRAVFITGWMDARDRSRLLDILRDICAGRFIVTERRDKAAPVRLLNIPWLKPFELLVRTMGMPSGREIDPTPLTAVTFTLMFGLMFGDLGQGLVLALGGWLLRRFGRKKSKDDLVEAGGILMICGFSAAVCGLLYGSLFSSEHLIPALWFHPTHNIMTLFAVTILMGVVFITVGLAVNILNSLRNADYVEALLEKRSLAILVLYVAVIVFAVGFQRTGAGPPLWALSAFVFFPLLVFSLRGPLGALLFAAEKPHDRAEYVVETVMDIVEIALGLFANTISFIRVGAFALSHAGLSIVTYTLAGMVDPTLRSAGAILMVIIGNIFIIGFEGLICGIQSMRLEYYEFFSKFFQGDGVAFRPFTLKAKAAEV